MRSTRFPLLFLAMAAGLFAQGSQTLIDNDQVRVVKVTDQPHTRSQPHDHKLNRVMVYLQAGRQDVTPQGGKTATSEWKAGEVTWSPKAGTHVSEIVSGEPVTIIELEIKKDGDPRKTVSAALDPLKVDPRHYKLEFENSQVRVTRVRIGARESAPLHEHVLDRVVVYLTGQNTKVTTPDGKVETVQHKAGEVSWAGAAKHQEENLNSQPFEGVVIEFKN